ncbi:MAG TPA: heme-copper oxidase subunit III [Acidimicrobiales bacterium]|jgi:cytochrome c oxidase subunit 3/cytochrome o ubiquinol oxidase subunit 3
MSDAVLTTEGSVSTVDHHDGEHLTSTGISNEKLAMWVFLGSDCLLFGALISTYLLLRHRSISGPPALRNPADVFDIPFTSVSSFILLMSSLTMALAVGAIHRGDMRRCQAWLVTTAGLGMMFISGQVYEFTSFKREGLGYTTNLFGSAFYTLTGFHGVHVTVGIVFLMSLFVMSLRGKLDVSRAETVEIFGLYWHFVDIVWILIFTVVYLIP